MPEYKTPKYIRVDNSGQTEDSINQYGKIDGCYRLNATAAPAKLSYEKQSIDWSPTSLTQSIVVKCCESFGEDYYMMNGSYHLVWKSDHSGPELRNGKPYWKLITKRKEGEGYSGYPGAENIINTIEWKPPPGEYDSNFCNWRIGSDGQAVKHHGTWVMRSSEKKPNSPGTKERPCCPDDDGYGVVYAYQVKKIDGVPGLTGQTSVLEGKYAHEYPKNGPWTAVCADEPRKWGNPCLTTKNMFKKFDTIKIKWSGAQGGMNYQGSLWGYDLPTNYEVEAAQFVESGTGGYYISHASQEARVVLKGEKEKNNGIFGWRMEGSEAEKHYEALENWEQAEEAPTLQLNGALRVETPIDKSIFSQTGVDSTGETDEDDDELFKDNYRKRTKRKVTFIVPIRQKDGSIKSVQRTRTEVVENPEPPNRQSWQNNLKKIKTNHRWVSAVWEVIGIRFTEDDDDEKIIRAFTLGKIVSVEGVSLSEWNNNRPNKTKLVYNRGKKTYVIKQTNKKIAEVKLFARPAKGYSRSKIKNEDGVLLFDESGGKNSMVYAEAKHCMLLYYKPDSRKPTKGWVFESTKDGANEVTKIFLHLQSYFVEDASVLEFERDNLYAFSPDPYMAYATWTQIASHVGGGAGMGAKITWGTAGNIEALLNECHNYETGFTPIFKRHWGPSMTTMGMASFTPNNQCSETAMTFTPISKKEYDLCTGIGEWIQNDDGEWIHNNQYLRDPKDCKDCSKHKY